MKENKTNDLREEAVEILYESLKSKHDITKEECYEIYDRMQEANLSIEKKGS